MSAEPEPKWLIHFPDNPASGFAYMNPTPVEKLILLMLSEIYDHLRITGGTVDGVKVKAAVTSGNTWSLPNFYNDDYNMAEAEYVRSVLKMWEHIEKSIEVLSPEDKEKIPVQHWGADITRFPGFYSSKRGARCLSIAEHMTDDLGLWSRFAGRVRSQSDDEHDMEDRYDNMLKIYPVTGLVYFGKPMRLHSILSMIDAYLKEIPSKEGYVDYDEPVYDITDV